MKARYCLKHDLWLIRFTSDYYHHPIGEVVASALPVTLRQGQPRDPVIRKIGLTPLGAQTDTDVLRKRAKRQAELLDAAQGCGIHQFRRAR